MDAQKAETQSLFLEHMKALQKHAQAAVQEAGACRRCGMFHDTSAQPHIGAFVSSMNFVQCNSDKWLASAPALPGPEAWRLYEQWAKGQPIKERLSRQRFGSAMKSVFALKVSATAGKSVRTYPQLQRQ